MEWCAIPTVIGRVPVVILYIEVPRIGVITDITASTSQKALIQYSIKQENEKKRKIIKLSKYTTTPYLESCVECAWKQQPCPTPVGGREYR
tara:strand:+ start:277 stop:549 length:273 start_codon:yes stop_codon:yes gene_type:complete